MIHATYYFNRCNISPGDKTSILNITFVASRLKQFSSPIWNHQDRRKPHSPAITGPGTHDCVLLVFCVFLNGGERITVRPCSSPTAIEPLRAAFSRQPMPSIPTGETPHADRHSPRPGANPRFRSPVLASKQRRHHGEDSAEWCRRLAGVPAFAKIVASSTCRVISTRLWAPGSMGGRRNFAPVEAALSKRTLTPAKGRIVPAGQVGFPPRPKSIILDLASHAISACRSDESLCPARTPGRGREGTIGLGLRSDSHCAAFIGGIRYHIIIRKKMTAPPPGER